MSATMEELEAEQVYLLMRKEYRISRNVRAQWYFAHLDRFIQVPKRHLVDEYQDELEVVSVIPAQPPPDWDSDTSHLYRYRVTERTGVTFLARVYRLVFCLDLSPSVATVDTRTGAVLLDAVFPTLKRCLEGITRPFYVPGSELLYKPQLYVTVIAHTPFFTTQTHQVLVQGWLLTEDNLRSFLDTVAGKLNTIEDRFADVTALANDQLEAQRLESERLVGKLFDVEASDGSGAAAAVPMVSPDMGFVNMLRYGILALQLLPENSSAGLVVVTDGAIGLPDATMFDSLLVQLRNNTVACSFLLLGAGCQPAAGLGALPYTDLMHFLATATCGALLCHLPAVTRDYDYTMNVYHRAFLSWGFQKSLVGLSLMQDREGGDPADPWPPEQLRSCVPETPVDLITKHQSEGELTSSLESVLSCRLREGYNIRSVEVADDNIHISLVLPWKYSIFIEYLLRSAWPPSTASHSVHYIINIRASYDFLHDVTCARTQTKSPYRKAMFSKFWSSLKAMRHSDQLLEHLHSFNSSATLYLVPEVVKSGSPLFTTSSFIPSDTTGAPEPFSGEPSYQAICTFWKPVCMLDINIWQKWMHAHRIGLLLEHDHPLPKHLYLPNNSGRYTSVQCRQATKAVTSLLARVSDFALLDGHSYIKFIYGDEEPGAPPTSFYMLRVNLAVRPPCMVVRLAFLGGTPGDLRNQIVRELRERILSLTFTEGQTAFSADPPIRKRAKLIEKPAMPKTVAIDDGGPERDRVAPEVHYGGSRGATQEVHCCFLLKKPVEKFLIRYDRVPRNFLSPVIQQSASLGATRHHFTAVNSQNRTASTMFNTLSRYLHHRRWVWEMQEARGPSISMAAMGRILSTVVKSRLQEGFGFAHSSLGVLNLVLELELQQPQQQSGRGAAQPPAQHTLPFVVQYVLFPPHLTAPAGSRDNLSMSEDEPVEAEIEVPESDAQAQIVTECWIEPQSGHVVTHNDCQTHFNRLTYDQVASKFYELDRESVSVLVTMEYLSMMCECSSGEGVPSPDPMPDTPVSDESAILRVPFCFDLPRLLRRCQQAELLLSTYIQNLADLESPCSCGGSSRSARHDPDAGNRELYRLLLETAAALHQRELQLTERDCRLLPALVAERQRPARRRLPPFNTDLSGRVPRWKCFVKAISSTHVVVTVLPASFQDLKQLVWGGPDSCQLVSESGADPLSDSRAHSQHTDSVGSAAAAPPARSASLSTRAAAASGRRTAPGPPPALRSRACSAGAAAKKTVTLVTDEPADGESDERRRPARHRTRHPSSPSKLQHGELSDPGQCPHRSRSFPNSEAGQRRRAWSRPCRRRPALLGSLALPVYVYDCALRSLTQQLGYRAGGGQPADICRDARFSLLQERTDAPKAGQENTDEPQEAAEEPPHLVEHCNVMQLAHTRAFVVGVFRALQAELPAHPLDVQTAVDLCDEQPLEVDVTDFLKTICGHIRDFGLRCNQLRRSGGGGEERRLPLALLHGHQPCERLQLVHAEVRRKFAHLLRASFGTAPASPDVYFYLPPDGRRALDDDGALPDDYPERVPSADNDDTTVQLNDIDGTDIWAEREHPEEIFSVVTRTSLMSNVDSESAEDLEERAVEVGELAEEENMPPLFLQLTCTTRTGCNTYTRHIRHLPTCIGELTGEIAESDISLDSIQVTLDILCLTLPYQVEARISEHAKHQVRATSFCSDGLASSDLPDALSCGSAHSSDLDSFNASQLGAQLGHLSEYQHQAVTATKAELQWLLTDEIAALLLDSYPPTSSVLTLVADHVGRSAVLKNKKALKRALSLVPYRSVNASKYELPSINTRRLDGQIQSSRPRRGCVHKQIPLNFVYGAGKSLDKFMEEFQRLKVPGYKLAELNDLYYLVHESSSCEVPTFSRLVPPLVPARHATRFTSLTPPADAPMFAADELALLPRPCTPDALMAQAMLARSISVDLCQYATSQGSPSDEECPCRADLEGSSRRRLRRSVSHRPSSSEAALSREDREVAALFSGAPAMPRRRPRSQVCEALGAAPETRRCRSAAEVRDQPPQHAAAGRASAGSSRFDDNPHLTDKGYEGDGDNNTDTDHEAGEVDHEPAQRILLPQFWLILRVSDKAVDTFFHCRYRRENICDNKAVHDQVIAKINHICKLVNQMLLLQELELTRVCDNLLEPESSADIWRTDEHLSMAALYSQPSCPSPDELSGHYLEANMKFQPGHFACPLVWSAQFALHPRLRGSAHAATPGLAYLRQALETFAVTNRRNMFVFKDPKPGQVFYLRLQEYQPGSAHPSGDSAAGVSLDERLSLQQGRHSVTSLKDENSRRTSVGERESAARSGPDDGIQLLVHGITEPGPSIKEDLVQLLHKRLDERLLELFSKALLRNPQTKLAPEDVHFIQPPGTPPDRSLKYTLPASATPHLSAVVDYLRNNLLQLLHQPKYTDGRPESHFRDWGGGEDADMFLYVPLEKHGGRGMACLSLSAVRTDEAAAGPAGDAAGLDWRPEQFEALTTTRLYDPDHDGAVDVLLQFNIWEKGRANLTWLETRLPSAIRYALWDLCMVCGVLPHAPLESTVARDLSGALRAGRALDESTSATMARFLDRRISSPLTQLQERLKSLSSSAPQDPSPATLPDTAPSSGQSTPRLVAAEPPPAGTPLRPTYGDHLRLWLEFGSALNVPNLKRISIQLSNRYTIGAFLSGLMRLVQEECPSLRCHLYGAEPAGTGYTLCDVSTLDASQSQPLLVVAHGQRDDYAALAAHRLSFSGQPQSTPSAADGGGGQCSSVPPSPGPGSAHTTFRTPGAGETPGSPYVAALPAARQKLVWARVQHKQVELYTYNWPKEKWEHLQVRCTELCQWTNARCSLLHSVVAQKLGLFHHQPFTRRYDQASDKTVNMYQNQMAHITPLIRSSTPPTSSAGPHRARPGRARLFTETLRDCKPVQLAPPAAGSDAIARHGQQLIEVYQANRKGDEQKKLYHQCQTPESLDKDTTMESFVRLLKGSGRLLHFCFTPLLFLPSWRWQTAVTRDQALLSARELAAAGMARTGRRGRLRHPSESSLRSGGRPSPRLRRQAADERWHETLCTSLLSEYLQYLQTMGFLPLQLGLRPGRAADGAGEPAVTAYLHRVVCGGGYLLFQIGIEEPFFYVKLYALEGLRVRMRSRAAHINPQTFQSFLTECDEIRAHTHLHSYLHDYHLRMMQLYVSGRPLLLRQGLHVISFLEDFYNYYPKGPSHARNFMATGTLTIEEQTSTSPDQLYNYLLTHEKRYRMRVLRMIPLFEDSGDDTAEDEYVLVQLSTQEVRRPEGPQSPLVYDLALVVSRDTAHPAADARLRLKFYVLMTSRREIYPSVFIERRFENYRRVDTAPGVLSDPPPAAAGAAGRRRARRSETGGAANEEAAPTSTAGSGFFSSYSTLRPESVHYLGYFSSHEQFMQKVLQDEVERVRRRVLEVVQRAKVHCRRDSLWQRLKEEEDRSRNSAGLTCAEVTELLTLVHSTPLEDIDPRLAPLVKQPLGWYSGLIRTLTHKYSDSHRYYLSESGQQRYLVVILPAELSSLLVLSVDAEAAHQPARLYMVTRDPTADQPELTSPSAEADQALYRLMEEFVNCCCYQMWAGFIQ